MYGFCFSIFKGFAARITSCFICWIYDGGYGGIGKSSLLCGLKNQPLSDEPSSTLMADCHMISGQSRPSQSSWTSSKGQAFWKDVTEEEEYIEMARLILQARI